MALKITQSQLKKKFKEEIKGLRWAIHAQCFDCVGFQADGYQNCEINACPLYPYRLKQPVGKTSASLASYLKRSKAKIQQK